MSNGLLIQEAIYYDSVLVVLYEQSNSLSSENS